jgi:glyceraldehyde 3-phosphate dehydrogenase
MTARVAINGFGRIGRAAFKIMLDRDDCEVVAINDLTNPRTLAYLLEHDTAYGNYTKEIFVEEDGKEVRTEDFRGEKDFFTQTANETYLVIDGKKIKVVAEPEPAKLPWKDLEIDVVLECTGRFVKDGASIAHIEAGAKKVVVSAPTKGTGDIQTFVKGVNDNQYLGQNALSNASCTTNCTAPVVSVLHSKFGVKKAMLTTVHAVTTGQNIVDGPPNPRKPDLRRARAGWMNMTPTSTGAAKATTKTIPDLEGKFDGVAIRVPVITGSLTDVTMLLDKKTTIEEVIEAYVEAEKNPIYKGVLETTYEPIVSSDIIGNPHSAIVDLNMTRVVDGDLVKVLAWYDNEMGYSHRLVEMALLAAN